MPVQKFAVADPATFEGTPYEVAERALRQARAIVKVAHSTLADSEVMVRNAQLSRNLVETPDEARADEWPENIQARKLHAALEKLDEVSSELSTLARAAGYDPKG